MSSGPIIPEGAAARVKSWWQTPDGKTRITSLFFLGAVGALVVFNFAAISTYILSLLDTWVHICILTAEILGMGYLAFGKLPRMAFRLAMYKITDWLVHIDPIGILNDHIRQMEKRLEEMKEQIKNVSEQLGILKRQIATNKADAEQSLAKAEEAKRQAMTTTDPDKKVRMSLQMQSFSNHAARVTAANQNYQVLLDRFTTVYGLLNKWAAHIDYFINDTKDQVRQQEIEYNTSNAATSALHKAMKVVGGNSFEDQTYRQTMQYLADRAGAQLGELENFQVVTQKFMDGIDVETGAAQTQALAQLDAYEQKMLTSSNPDTAFLKGAPEKQPTLVRAAAASSDDDYNILK